MGCYYGEGLSWLSKMPPIRVSCVHRIRSAHTGLAEWRQHQAASHKGRVLGKGRWGGMGPPPPHRHLLPRQPAPQAPPLPTASQCPHARSTRLTCKIGCVT